jgi:hypothetical protein
MVLRAVIAPSVYRLGYGLDDRGSRVRFQAEAGNFSLHHRVQNGSAAHPASYPVGIRGREASTHLHLVPRSNNAWSYTSTLPVRLTVTISFSKYLLPWQAIHFLQRSTYFSKTCCRPLITLKFLTSELPFHGYESPEIAWARYELNSVFGLEKVDRWNPIRTSPHKVQISPHAISGLFQPWKCRPETRNFEAINGLQHIFEKWVERCKK